MRVGQIVKGKIQKVLKTHIIVKFPNEWIGLLHISNISDYFVFNISSIISQGEEHYFLVEKVKKEEKKVKLNWKKLIPRFTKNPFEFEIKETKSGFVNLKKFTRKEVEND